MVIIESVFRNNKKLKKGKDYHICHTKLISPIVKLHFKAHKKTSIKINYKIL